MVSGITQELPPSRRRWISRQNHDHSTVSIPAPSACESRLVGPCSIHMHTEMEQTVLTHNSSDVQNHRVPFVCGGEVPQLPLASVMSVARNDVGRERAIVIEADEFRHAFLGLAPMIAVLTNVDYEHVDCYPYGSPVAWIRHGRCSCNGCRCITCCLQDHWRCRCCLHTVSRTGSTRRPGDSMSG